MPMSPKKKSAPEFTTESARALIHGTGLRRTSARIAVLKVLATASQPLSHADLVSQTSETGIDQSTIHRSLVELCDVGLLTKIDVGDQIRRYELKPLDSTHSAVEAAEHPHFVCVDCHRVTCLTAVQIALPKASSKNSPGRVTEVLLRGHCHNCEK
ncbi:MAG: transcriptional repressor [Planctomycetaceae bacterium]|nr:transcriptional repressor [Planctomycetaceae bacterium]